VVHVGNINIAGVGFVEPAITHVRAASAYGVVNADPALRRMRGEVCALRPATQFQGIALSVVTPVAGTRLMGGAQFDKYKTGSHAIGLTG
jgi:hypothetical protein